MDNKTLVWFSKKINDSNKKKIVILIVFCFIILIAIFSFYKSINSYLYSGIMKTFNYNYNFITYANTGDSLDEALTKIKSIEHIDDVFIDDYQLYSIYLDSISGNKIDGSFYLVGINDKLLAKKLNVNKKLNNNDIICPKSFYPSDDIEGNKLIMSKNIINLGNMIDSKIKLHYFKYINDYYSERKDIELNLISTYENNNNVIDENICYTSRELLKSIFDDAYENLDLSNQKNSIIAVIENRDYYENIRSQVESYGYEITSSFTLNEKLFSFIRIISYVLTIGSILFVIVFLSNINRRRLNDKTNELGIMRSIGANKKDILKILTIEACSTFILSILYSIFTFGIIFYILKLLLNVYPFIFNKVPLKIDYYSVIVFMIIIMFILIIENIIYYKKITNCTIMDNINE